MGRDKRYHPEQVMNLLRQIEVAAANGKTTAQGCKEAGLWSRLTSLAQGVWRPAGIG